MNQQPSPPHIIMMAAGGVLLLSSFLAWSSGPGGGDQNAWSWGFLGLFWLICIIGALVGVYAAARAFAFVELPNEVVGFRIEQIALVLAGWVAVSAILLLPVSDAEWGIGYYLALLAGIGSAVGAFLDLNQTSSPSSPAPPQSF